MWCIVGVGCSPRSLANIFLALDGWVLQEQFIAAGDAILAGAAAAAARQAATF